MDHTAKIVTINTGSTGKLSASSTKEQIKTDSLMGTLKPFFLAAPASTGAHCDYQRAFFLYVSEIACLCYRGRNIKEAMDQAKETALRIFDVANWQQQKFEDLVMIWNGDTFIETEFFWDGEHRKAVLSWKHEDKFPVVSKPWK